MNATSARNVDAAAPLSWRQRAAIWFGFWIVVALVAWLDRGCGLGVQRADIFTAIWAGIQVVGSWLGAAGGAIATSLEGVVAYLVSAVAWLGSQVASILLSTGSVFAKVWEGLRTLWSDVLKPALVWVDQQLGRLQGWLKDTFAPVFNFLARIRDELMAIYRRFVQPIIDTIEFIRALNRVLLAFHIHFLQGLDTVLQQIEQRIEEPILWINAKLNEIWNALELVVTLDGFFQRLTLVRSMGRYAPDWMRISTNARMTTLSETEAYKVGANTQPQETQGLIDQTVAWWEGEQNDTGDALDAAVQRALDLFNAE